MLSINKMMILATGWIFFTAGAATFANTDNNDYREGNTMPTKPIQQVLKEHTKDLMSLPGVVGTAQGLCDGEPCIKVFVIKKTPELEAKIPESLEGYAVSIEETGEIRALPEDKD